MILRKFYEFKILFFRKCLIFYFLARMGAKIFSVARKDSKILQKVLCSCFDARSDEKYINYYGAL